MEERKIYSVLMYEGLEGNKTVIKAEKVDGMWLISYIDDGVEDMETVGRDNEAYDVAQLFDIASHDFPQEFCEAFSASDLEPGSYVWLAEYNEETDSIIPNYVMEE